MGIPKAVKLVDAPEDYSGIPAEELAVVGGVPSGGGSAGVTSVNGETGDVVLELDDLGGAPLVHTHTVAQIEGLQDILDGYETRIAALEGAGE